jgi:DNA-directed RNA polymerase specialized sigma24 family protein
MLDPHSDELFELHKKLLSGDRAAAEEILYLLIEPLQSELEQRFSAADEQLIATGVSDALLDYAARPDRAQVRRGSGLRQVMNGSELRQFLVSAAWRNVSNAYRGETRRKKWEALAVSGAAQSVVEEHTPLGILIQNEDVANQERLISRLMVMLPDPCDREILRLRLEGERKTEVFARAMGLSDLSLPEQRRLVKQAKDRIEKVLKRSKELGL